MTDNTLKSGSLLKMENTASIVFSVRAASASRKRVEHEACFNAMLSRSQSKTKCAYNEINVVQITK